ncbi:UvrD-like helicase, ATP-binding domain, P-loop containing nucleoside triphosphate hydrolase [Tanacetum coccineum]
MRRRNDSESTPGTSSTASTASLKVVPKSLGFKVGKRCTKSLKAGGGSTAHRNILVLVGICSTARQILLMLAGICSTTLVIVVEKIPLTFMSERGYLGSFVNPLLEETRAGLASSMEVIDRAPFAEVAGFREGKRVYDVTVNTWRNRFSERGKEPYLTLPGDLLILVDGKPESVSDLQHMGRTWNLLLVKSVVDDEKDHIEDDNVDDTKDHIEDDSTSRHFKVMAPRRIEFQDGMFVIFLMNITTEKRIWDSLHIHRDLKIVKEIICSDSMVKENCSVCSFASKDLLSQKFDPHLMDKLNESQRSAIMSSVRKTGCCHNSYVEQIWGPPGTGKTSTVSVLLFILLQMNRRILTCAPTNVAVVQVASRVLRLAKEQLETITPSGYAFCSLGDVLLFGNKKRLKVGIDFEEIYLEHRVEKLLECLGPDAGWKTCINSMMNLQEDCVSEYHVYVGNELFEEKRCKNENQMNKEQHLTIENGSQTEKLKLKSFIEFLRDRFSSVSLPLERCIVTFCTHISRRFMGERNFQNMISLLENLRSFESLLFQENLVSDKLEELLSSKPLQDDVDTSSINYVRATCLSVLRILQISLGGLGLPDVRDESALMDFCFENASLIFCTTSSSYKLHRVKMEPLNILVIDEAAQLKEAESTIPLQLPGMRHAILIGDECQLPAMVTSNVCVESGYGKSLFERLSSLGHPKHLLNVQYRMHPSISFFPNWKFYQNQILDAQNVTYKDYEKRYLPGPMFGTYSFINVVGGREEKDDDDRSWRNLVEVAVVMKILHNVYKAWNVFKEKLTIGVVSPYSAQVVSIQEKLARKYEKLDGFSVKVKSIDGFQGGEEDIIILSTVRSNSRGSVGFISSPQRTNVALTRARHCLWILGNERTLLNSESVWTDLVHDARNRHSLFDADSDDSLKMTIISAKKELEQLDDLVNGNSVLFKHAKWKVLFSDDFRRSFGKLTSARLKKLVLNLLLKLSGGWRPKSRSVDLYCENSLHILKQFKVEGLYVICTIDIIKECKYIQVLKVWDILPLEDISKLTKRLDIIFSAYTEEYINRCTTKCLEGNLEVPSSWPASQEVKRFRYSDKDEGDSDLSVNPSDGRSFIENSKVSESLLLMKFYSLSRGVVSHLLSGKELDLPMQVTDEQVDIILFPKSSFIIGRSGTGKTTILTMKLFQNEQSFGVASEGLYDESRPIVLSEEDDSEESKPTVLHQLFVTVSPKLCYAVKQHVSHLTSISSNGNSSAEINLDNVDVGTSGFSDIPDTFVGIPVRSYPLVITFHKFLMMLDGTLGNSFFERFHEAREGSLCNNISSRSVSLQTFIRLREVTFDRFCSLYWPHFNSSLTKKLDPSRVFTEIISHIKGGLQSGECSDGKLSYEDYCLLAETRSSTLVKQKRDRVYTLFQVYEKMKTERGEFDLGDLVNDIHYRLKHGNYIGDQMDFVYIDEVQDLSMRQISLFKYICQNVDEGFVFAGDTAQTIARGIDFRFQDIRSLFYKEFLSTGTSGKQEKGLVSEIFQLKQNFRTHAGVLELAQSVIDILYCYFAHSIDILEPETSLISGEAPVLLESGNDENAIVTIFGGSGSGGEIVGFGAEQVILVRDDCAKSEICEYVGKHALVLTIVECKGLEFQDVLLYNFFGTSPLKDQWRVIYGYMKERDWLDEKITRSFPTFSESRHSVLCSELKQLYVAITRTRQRLWICENREELSKPMFDYWKSRGLVQIRKLDDSVAQAMRVASSPEEWRERGKKLFYESNFVMATMCFERARDTMWEKLAKASGLRASADQMRGTNPEAFVGYLRDAAGMFESIGKLESAALCYCDLGEYERAGKIYLHKCGKLDAAAQCFNLAGCYSDAAEAYAKGNQFSSCLLVCKKGKLFDKGLEYIECWKEHSNVRSKEIEDIEQEFLHTCALYYHGCKDFKSMMKFVRAFCSMDSKRAFLRSFDCLGDLLNLEEESGNFLDAAELASSWGDVLKEADLLEKAGNNTKATDLLLWYIFFGSVWGNGNRGWPLKQFPHKDQLCRKVKSLAKTDSNVFYDFVCSELKVLSDQKSSLNELKKDLDVSHENKSLKGEILSIRKILDAHFHLNFSKYEWEDELPIDTRNMVYLLVNKDADWIRNCGQKGLHRDGKRLTYDGKELVCAIRSYWQSELLSVDGGISVFSDLILFKGDASLSQLCSMRVSLLIVDVKGDLSYLAIGRVMMIYVGKVKHVALYEHLSNGLQWNPAWKSFATKFRDGGFIDVHVVPALQNALEDTFRANWRCARYISPHCFVHLLDCVLFMASLSSRTFFTTRSSFVGWLKHLQSTTTLNASRPIFSQQFVSFMVGIIQQILYNKPDTLSWIERSGISYSYYHPLMALKLVMIVSLICLQVSDCFPVLLDLLSGRSNIAYLLPKKFVSILLRRRKGRYLNLALDLVAEAFISIEDPLLIVSSENASLRIHAPCAIFVDRTKSKEEMMSLLFPSKITRSVDMIPEVLLSNKSSDAPNVNAIESQINWKVLEETSEALNGEKGVALNRISIATRAKNELDDNIRILSAALVDGNFCAGKKATVVREVNSACDDLKLVSSVFDPSRHGVKNERTNVQVVFERLQRNRSLIDNFLNQFCSESKVMRNMMSEGSKTSDALKKEHNVDETGDDHINADKSPVEVVTQDAKSNKGMGSGKRKKAKKNKGRKK